jgi:uncharacterized OsmC-like protein
MYTLQVTYDGHQHATAINEPHHNVVRIDCPYTSKGDEFSPASLLGISLASCMLLSMGAIAQRDQLDLTGTTVDITLEGMEQRIPHVDAINLRFQFPNDFAKPDRRKLEHAAALCPIMASIDAATTVTATFEFGQSPAEK